FILECLNFWTLFKTFLHVEFSKSSTRIFRGIIELFFRIFFTTHVQSTVELEKTFNIGAGKVLKFFFIRNGNETFFLKKNFSDVIMTQRFIRKRGGTIIASNEFCLGEDVLPFKNFFLNTCIAP